jgi:aminoacyl tRNA synthase complex-interacting multifunctional protein 1
MIAFTVTQARCLGCFKVAHGHMVQSSFNKGCKSSISTVKKICAVNRLHSSYVIHAADASSAESTEATQAETPDVSKLDIRVGTIISAEDHPEADSLYVEQIDLGEEEGPRTIVSGLKKYVSLDDIQGKKVLVLANLKARNMRGIKSHGMLLCASNEDHTEVEPLSAPEEAPNGERVFFGSGEVEQGEAALPNQLQKKKFWEQCQPLLKTDASGEAIFDGTLPMMTSAGQVKAAKLFNASIS